MAKPEESLDPQGPTVLAAPPNGARPARRFLESATSLPDLAAPSSTELPVAFTDEDDHAIVQHRLALLYGVLGVITLLLYAAGVVIALFAMPERFWSIHLGVPKLVNVVAGLGFLGVWWTFRAELRPRWLVSTLDLLGSEMIMVAAGIGVAIVPPEVHAELVIFIPLVLITSLRAAIVPSPPRWTALVALVTAAPAPVAVYWVATHDSGWDATLVPPAVLMAAAVMWSGVVVASAWVIAKVVYGLRAEVKKKMRLGQYTLEDKIGEGGMGVVYRAKHALLRRPTAIKLLSRERATAQDVRRFEREVQLTSALTHPNTVAIYDFGHTHDGIFYYAMEHLDGMSLHDLVDRDGPQPPRRVLHILSQIASALAEAHDVGLVHRDVKPANVFLCERGGLPDFVKVLDFGLVKHVQGQDSLVLSHVGAIAGTPHYMAPESITDPATVDARADIYALGAVGYFLLTGLTVFDGANLVEICSHHLHTAPEPPSSRGPSRVPASLEKIILDCLAKSRDERPKDASVLVERFKSCVTPADDDEWDEIAAREWWRRERASRAPAPPPTKSAGPKARALP